MASASLPEPPPLSSDFECPKRRFGRTGIQISVITMGGMRMQQTWKKTTSVTASSDPREFDEKKERKRFDPECQRNLENIVKRAEELGINHIETARAYGSSEVQLGIAFRKLGNRDKFFVQSKMSAVQDRSSISRAAARDVYIAWT